MSKKYYTLLDRTIAAAKQDPAQLRALVYQLARLELERALPGKRNSVYLAAVNQQITALETAIEQIESNHNDDRLLTSEASSGDDVIVTPGADAAVVQDGSPRLPMRQAYTPEVLPPLGSPFRAGDLSLRPFATEAEVYAQPVGQSGRDRATSWSTWHLVVVTTLAIAIFSGLQESGNLLNFITRTRGSFLGHGRTDAVLRNQDKMRITGNASGKHVADSQQTPSAASNSGPLANLPIPSVFGVYAINDGQLRDLGLLPIKIPDPRVQISGLISNPSAAVLTNGRLQFIAFRRDLVDSAPDHATVRVVARVMHELTFNAGHAKTVDVQGSWAVRGGIAYDMKVGPVTGHPDMILIRPSDTHFTFPAGRYALALKNTAYDFSVAGPITDPAQCLERTDAMNEPVYNECRSP
jgi:hypothetical protein